MTLLIKGDSVRVGGMPSLDVIHDLMADHKKYYKGFHDSCLKAESYYFGHNVVAHPKDFNAINPPAALAIINIATDHVDVNNIAIDVPEPSPRAKARAERIKKFLIGFWSSQKNPVLRTAAKHSFAYGVAVLKSMFASDMWPNAPVMDDYEREEQYKEALERFLESKRLKFPLLVSNVNPKQLLWDDSKAGSQWAIEFYERPVRSLALRYPAFLPSGQSELTNWIEYWDKEWCGYAAGDTWVYGPEKHSYGDHPYTLARAASSLDWDDGSPEERYRGILDGIYSLLDDKARTMTAYAAILRQFAWRTMDFYGPEQQARSTAEDYELFGSKNIIKPGVEVRASPVAMPPPELLSYLSLLDTEIEMATFPNVIRGLRPRGVATGFAIGVLAGMGRLVFQGVADGLSRAMEQVNSKILMLVENKVKGEVTVHARSDIHNFDQTIGPDDIRGLYENRVVLKAEAPEERERESLLAFRLWDHGLGTISLQEAQRRSGVANPLEEQNLQEAERLLYSPELRAEKIRLAMEGLGLLNQLAQAADLQTRGLGNQFLPGLTQSPILDERSRQQSRVASRNMEPSVFPKGLGGLDILGRKLGSPGGGAVGFPSGETLGG